MKHLRRLPIASNHICSETWSTKAAMDGNAFVNDEGYDFGDDDSLCNKRCCWWSPSQDSVAVEFCRDTSIHGFKFFGQPKRHLSERIFWLIAWLVSLFVSVYLIYTVWNRYNNVPVVVTFQASSQDIDSISFPAVTLCNINKFPKTKVKELQRIAGLPSHEKYQQAKRQLTFVRSVCNAQKSFAKEFDFAFHRGTKQDESVNDTIAEHHHNEMMDFLLENTIPCDELVRLCLLGDELEDCSTLFKPVITDYGKCCTFNMYPLPLLVLNPRTSGNASASIYDNPVLGSHGEHDWPKKEIDEWRKWNYHDGFVLDESSTRPWKQMRAGQPYGLSVLVDPNVDEYYCPVSDSEGIRYILHSSLEMPHVMEFSSVAALNKEILVEVHPDMTNADDDIRYIDQLKRKCYFGTEKTLELFGPYTGGNCNDECTAMVLQWECNCTFFYMPRDKNVLICNTDHDSADFKCIQAASIHLQTTLKDNCGHCDVLCQDIAYNYETTIAELQDVKRLWLDPNPKTHGTVPPKWATNDMSIIHIFFGSDSTVPKYRKRVYGTTDLIASTGGILGLCLGFSILSAVEFVYFISLRTFWKYCRRRMGRRRRGMLGHLGNTFVKMFRPHRDSSRIIRLNPDKITIYPISPAYQFERHSQFLTKRWF